MNQQTYRKRFVVGIVTIGAIAVTDWENRGPTMTSAPSAKRVLTPAAASAPT